MATIVTGQQETMAMKSALAQALERGTRDEIYQALNILQLDLAGAIADHARATLASLYEEVSRLLLRYQDVVEAPEVSPAYVAGQLAAVQDIIAALQEMRPAPEEMLRVSSARQREILLYLYHERSATPSELKEALKLDLPKVSTLGKELEEAGFLRRSRFGKYSHYELTSRGYAVAAELDRRRQAEAAEQPTLATVTEELHHLQQQIETLLDAAQPLKMKDLLTARHRPSAIATKPDTRVTDPMMNLLPLLLANRNREGNATESAASPKKKNRQHE